jgi:branched-chain amino acid aminotransferase
MEQNATSHWSMSARPTTDAEAQRICLVDGEFVPEADARISVFDHGVLYGDGVFDTVVAWNGSLFRLDDHIARLFRSMKAVALTPEFTADELRALTRKAVALNGLTGAYVKWIVTRGSNDTPLMDPAGCRPNLIILVRPYIERFAANAERGIHLKTVAIRRTPAQCLDPGIKNLNYLNLILAKMEAKAAQCDEALMLDLQGNICEAPGYNVFIAEDGKLLTPNRDILAGITRASVIDLAQARGIETSEQDVGLYRAYTADEVFLTSTAGGLIPVTAIDGRSIGAGRPGPVFAALSSAYSEILGSPEWGVAVDGSTQRTMEGRQ